MATDDGTLTGEVLDMAEEGLTILGDTGTIVMVEGEDTTETEVVAALALEHYLSSASCCTVPVTTVLKLYDNGGREALMQ